MNAPVSLPSQPTLPWHRIVQGKNPRTYFDPVEMAELEAGMRAAGRVLQPIIVRPIPGSDLFEVVAGERRWRSAGNVFGENYDMPVVIEALSDDEAEAFATIENHHRAPMSHADEAHAAQRTLMRCKGDKDEAAAVLGWKPEVLGRRLALLTCTPSVLEALTHRKIQLGHAELLAGVPPDKQDSVLVGVIERKVPVGVLKEQLGRFARRLADAIFDTGQCSACPHNSAQQCGLFDESLGEGFCQHPTHYDELTAQALDAKADGLREQYPVVRIVHASDAFTPLPVSADGALGVGPQQYAACQGCASFGCAVSALPGKLGDVTASLCFDAGCNARKISLWRKEQCASATDAQQTGAAPGSVAQPMDSLAKAAAGKSAKCAPSANQIPQRVLTYRVGEWRRWVARSLVAHPQRNQHVLIALTRYGHAGDARSAEYGEAMHRMGAGWNCKHGCGLADHLTQAERLAPEHLERLVQCVAASAAYGVNERDLLALLKYLEVDEARHFQWSKEFLELFTMSELESLANEVGLKKAMGSHFNAARASKKPEFIAALLKVPDFPYPGTVPAVMRYPRDASVPAEEEGEEGEGGGEVHADAMQADEAQAVA